MTTFPITITTTEIEKLAYRQITHTHTRVIHAQQVLKIADKLFIFRVREEWGKVRLEWSTDGGFFIQEMWGNPEQAGLLADLLPVVIDQRLGLMQLMAQSETVYYLSQDVIEQYAVSN